MAKTLGETGNICTGSREIEFKKVGDCEHYLRRCALATPCCNKVYKCRFCHDQAEDHELNRKHVEELECLQCKTRQKLAVNCRECGIKFGLYSCLDCRLFDDRDKGQFHCNKCGVCRVGGRDNFFHCENCQICLSINLKESHKCRSDSGKEKCPVCLELVYTASQPSIVPKCGHLIHLACYKMIQSYGYRTCPYCTAEYAQPRSELAEGSRI